MEIRSWKGVHFRAFNYLDSARDHPQAATYITYMRDSKEAEEADIRYTRHCTLYTVH